ncbi:MAG: hypothetical protein JST93_06635 [Acidobacteria bacterium]|nr:hypothetical protein [Acidobacteriota bacterium]
MKQSFEEFWRDAWQNSALFPIEAAVVFALLALLVWRRKSLLPAAWWSAYLRLAARRCLAVTVVFFFTLVGHYLAEPGYVKPVPGIHDEFSYLLAADTFLSGRLANPPHPMRYFFETFHVLMEPSYVSMYPPGQGLALALGVLLTGEPIAGAWLTAAALSAAVCWMLQGWLRPHWALSGGLLCAIRIGWFSYWANSYWGGALAATGGALVGGALPRLIRRPNSFDAVLLVLGFGILANTRPYEGLAFSLASLAYLGFQARRHSLRSWLHVLPKAAAIGTAGLAFMAYYNWRGTGNPLRPPYIENRAQYAIHGTFYGSSSNPGHAYNHEVMRRFYTVHEDYTPRRANFWRWPDKPFRFWIFFVGPGLTLAFAGLFVAGRTRPGRYAMLALGTLFAVHLPVVWDLFPHYAAPVVGAFYLLLIVCLQSLTVSWRRRRFQGKSIARAVILTCLIMAAVRGSAPAWNLPVFGETTQAWYNYGRTCNFFRARIEDRFTSMGGKHLILIQYDPQHRPEMEWVYNRAGIDAAPVVWARYVPQPDRLATLLAYFRDRHVWILYPDRNPNQIFDFKEQFR